MLFVERYEIILQFNIKKAILNVIHNLQNGGLVIGHITPQSDFATFIARDFHFVEVTPPRRLFFVFRKPYASRVGRNANFDSYR